MRTLPFTVAAVLAVASVASAQVDDDAADGRATSITIENVLGNEVCWTVEGNGTVALTAVYWDTESHAGTTLGDDNGPDANATDTDANATLDDDADAGTNEPDRLALYDGGIIYPNNTAGAQASGYPVPGRFCVNVTAEALQNATLTGGNATTDGNATMDANATVPATVYLVAAAVHADENDVLVSEEVSVAVADTTDDGTTDGMDDGFGDGNATDDDGAFDDGGLDGEEEAVGEEDTPGVGLVAALGVLAVAAFALRRR